MILYYGKNKGTEYSLETSYNKKYMDKSKKNRKNNSGNFEDEAYLQFNKYLTTLDNLVDNNKSLSRTYSLYYNCLEAHNEWYKIRVSKGFSDEVYTKMRTWKSSHIFKSAQDKFSNSYDKSINYIKDLCSGKKAYPFAFIPTTFHYNFKKFLKQYVCGISIFLTLYTDVHGQVHNGIFHPITHITHNLGGHHGLLNYNNKNEGTRYYRTLLNEYEKLNDYDDYILYINQKKNINIKNI